MLETDTEATTEIWPPDRSGEQSCGIEISLVSILQHLWQLRGVAYSG